MRPPPWCWSTARPWPTSPRLSVLTGRLCGFLSGAAVYHRWWYQARSGIGQLADDDPEGLALADAVGQVEGEQPGQVDLWPLRDGQLGQAVGVDGQRVLIECQSVGGVQRVGAGGDVRCARAGQVEGRGGAGRDVTPVHQ